MSAVWMGWKKTIGLLKDKIHFIQYISEIALMLQLFSSLMS